jgi:hypothetical protein
MRGAFLSSLCAPNAGTPYLAGGWNAALEKRVTAIRAKNRCAPDAVGPKEMSGRAQNMGMRQCSLSASFAVSRLSGSAAEQRITVTRAIGPGGARLGRRAMGNASSTRTLQTELGRSTASATLVSRLTTFPELSGVFPAYRSDTDVDIRLFIHLSGRSLTAHS